MTPEEFQKKAHSLDQAKQFLTQTPNQAYCQQLLNSARQMLTQTKDCRIVSVTTNLMAVLEHTLPSYQLIKQLCDVIEVLSRERDFLAAERRGESIEAGSEQNPNTQGRYHFTRQYHFECGNDKCRGVFSIDNVGARKLWHCPYCKTANEFYTSLPTRSLGELLAEPNP